MIINIKNEANGYSIIGSRGVGEKIRGKIKPYLDMGEVVTLDFNGVEQITQAFADEVIGIFVRAFGLEYIKGKILLANETNGIRDTFNFVVKYSKERHGNNR